MNTFGDKDYEPVDFKEQHIILFYFQNSPLRPSPPNQSPGTPGPPLMVGPGGPGFPPMAPRYAGGPRGPPRMRMPIMGPGGEPFNGHPGNKNTS